MFHLVQFPGHRPIHVPNQDICSDLMYDDLFELVMHEPRYKPAISDIFVAIVTKFFSE